MIESPALRALASTATQLAAFPSALWTFIETRRLPALPSANDISHAGFQATAGGLLGLGISVVAQNIEAKGVVAALTWSRLGLTELNWSALGSALVTGAAIGLSVGVATYLAREGRKARVFANEQNSPSSQSNVSLQKMVSEGPDAWAINRILDKDPSACPRLEKAVLSHTMALTHASAKDACTHAAISLGVAMSAQAGVYGPSVQRIKKDWFAGAFDALDDAPSAQMLLTALPRLGALKPQANVLEMHASWTALVNEQLSRSEHSTFAAAFQQWSSQYFQQAQDRNASVVRDCAVSIAALSKDSATMQKVHEEQSTMEALVAGALLEAPVSKAKAQEQNVNYKSMHNTSFDMV